MWRKESNKTKQNAWILTTVPQAAGLQESILDHSPPHMIYTLEHFTYTPFTCTRQIKIARPLSLHYTARPLGLYYNHYVSLARPLCLNFNIA